MRPLFSLPWSCVAIAGAITTAPFEAFCQQQTTTGYPEPVVQWGTQQGETCADISSALYGAPRYAYLLLRYNRINCASPLPAGLTLVTPAKVTTVSTARLKSMHPDVRARPAGGGWAPGASGQSLEANHNVQTMDSGRADIEFSDRTRVFLAPHTLVVIFGTAAQTKVSKAAPPRVEVQEGEVRTGLAALRGDPVEVAVTGGGQVSASSRDTVIARKGDRTTVAVFDGKAGIKSGGKSVEVPTNFGSRFVGNTPPTPPRPLPPAPVLTAETSPSLALESNGELHAGWQPVPNAASYRIEVARDESFGDPIAREEVPGDVVKFRAEKLPPGQYFVRVRAIDKEDYLGIAATRAVTLINAAVAGGAIENGTIQATRYSALKLVAPPGSEIALDDGAFGPIPPAIDLRRLAPKKLRLRANPGATPAEIEIRYVPVTAQIEATRQGDGAAVKVKIEGLAPAEVMEQAKPRLRVSGSGAPREFPLVTLDGAFFGVTVPGVGLEALRFDVVDDRGLTLGSGQVDEQAAPVIARPGVIVLPALGATSALTPPATDTSTLWLAPRPDSAAVAAGQVKTGDRRGYLLDTRVSGSTRYVGLDAAIRTRLQGDAPTDGTAWFGFRGLIIDTPGLELAALAHASVPTTGAGSSPQIEPGLAVGGRSGRLGWLVNAGGRIRTTDSAARAPTAAGQAFGLAGLTFDPTPLVRAYALADGHQLFSAPGGTKSTQGGVGLGLEVGRTVFGGASGRAGFQEGDKVGFSAQLSLGVRE